MALSTYTAYSIHENLGILHHLAIIRRMLECQNLTCIFFTFSTSMSVIALISLVENLGTSPFGRKPSSPPHVE